jgi:3-methyladenine DNA glycosylase AlkD
MNENYEQELMEMREDAYRSFMSFLEPWGDQKRRLGVRVPRLRALTKKIAANGDAEAFLDDLPHAWLEEDLIHAFLVSREKKFETARTRVQAFLPWIDSWEVCDSLRPKVFARHMEELAPFLAAWMQDPRPFTRRFAIEMRMAYGLKENYDKNDLLAIARLGDEDYYVQMMQAWYLTEAAVAHPQDVTEAFALLSKPVKKMTVRKILDSRKFTKEEKEEWRKR